MNGDTDVPQGVLDELAVAWSELDRCRPRHARDIPSACGVLSRWASAALAVDRVLASAWPRTYALMSSGESGGPDLEGLRWVWRAIEAGHDVATVVSATAGRRPVVWELYWRPVAELPADVARASEWNSYALYLASQPVRRPASATTMFLLSAAMRLVAEGASGPPPVPQSKRSA